MPQFEVRVSSKHAASVNTSHKHASLKPTESIGDASSPQSHGCLATQTVSPATAEQLEFVSRCESDAPHPGSDFVELLISTRPQEHLLNIFSRAAQVVSKALKTPSTNSALAAGADVAKNPGLQRDATNADALRRCWRMNSEQAHDIPPFAPAISDALYRPQKCSNIQWPNLAAMLDEMDTTPQDIASLRRQLECAGAVESAEDSVAHAFPGAGWVKRYVITGALEKSTLPACLGALPLGLGTLLGAPSASSVMFMAGNTILGPGVCAGVATTTVVGFGGRALLSRHVERNELCIMRRECEAFTKRLSDVSDRATLHRLGLEWRNVPGSTSKFATVRRLHNDITNQLISKFYEVSQADHNKADAALESLFTELVNGDPRAAEQAARVCAAMITDDENDIALFVAAVVAAAEQSARDGL